MGEKIFRLGVDGGVIDGESGVPRERKRKRKKND